MPFEMEGPLVYTRHIIVALALLLLVPTHHASAQSATASARTSADVQATNVPPQAQQVAADVEDTVRRFRVGVRGGIGLDPELIDFGAHATFGPIFTSSLSFRPGINFGVGEVTTAFAVNLDMIYTLPGATRATRWAPYVGAGPNFGLSHRGFSADIPVEGTDTQSRFNFGDTDFNAGFNFIAGARNRSGMFFEMNATAYGVSNVRLLAGYTF